KFPEARTLEARIEALPFADGSASAAVGLCVLDVLSDPAPAFRELRRIVAPGGRLIHFLDLAPNFEAALRELAREGKVALPNLFSDPSSSPWPADLLVTERTAMERLLLELRRASHPLPHVFGHYFENYSRAPFDAKKAAREYEAFTRTQEVRELLKTLLTSAFETGFRLGVPAPEGELASSGRRLAERLEAAAREAGFTLELSDIRTAWAHGARAPEGPSYRSIALGHERRGHELPERLLCEDAVPASESNVLLETAMFVLVARA
ncbi:MAG TPA: methyltransferase domain-containing protein, partial [Polyangiaceae bacterium]